MFTDWNMFMSWVLELLPLRYEKFVEALDEAAKDKLPFLKEKAVKVTFDVLFRYEIDWSLK